MKDVYLTLVSDVTSDYSGNVANKFKVKSKLRLPGEGWKVSIQSAILPRMCLFKEMQSEGGTPLVEMYYKVEGVSPNPNGWMNGNDVRILESLYKCRTGVEFLNEMKVFLDERRNYYIGSGKKVLKANWANLEWKRESGHPELMLSHSSNSTFSVLKKFAKSMRWMNPLDEKAGLLGTNLQFSYPSHIRERSELSTNEVQKLIGNRLYLSSKVDFRFINVNEAFVNALNLHARALIVSAKVTANSETVLQSLSQVYYAPEGRVRYLFTPPVEEFYEVQTDHWNEVEIELKELDGTLVNFQSDSQCLIRLHFKKD